MRVSPADIAAARAAHPLAFRAPLPVRIRRAALWGLFLGLIGWCLYDFDITPARIWTGLQRLGSVLGFMFPPHLWTTWEAWREVLAALGETLAMAFLGTVLGAVVAFPLCFLGARNINRIPWLRHGARRGYDIIRAFETLILALIFIRAFGLGPLAGILAIAVSEVGVFAKFFSEALENTSEKPVDGVRAAGGSRLQAIRYAIMPQVLPVHLSFVLYNWGEAWTIIALVIAMVYIIDGLSGLVRTRLIGRWEGAR
jgi:phosphonate transport system permease protein